MKVSLLVIISFLLISKAGFCIDSKMNFIGQYGITTPDTERMEGGAEFALGMDFIELPFIGVSGGKSGSTTYFKAFGGVRFIFFDHIGASGKYGYIKSSTKYTSTYYGTDISLICKISEKFFIIPFVEYNLENVSNIRTVYFGLKFGTILSKLSGSSSSDDDSGGSSYAY